MPLQLAGWWGSRGQGAVAAALGAVLVVAPYLRGTYFPPDQLRVFMALVALAGLAWMLLARRGVAGARWTTLDAAFIGLVGLYAASVLWAVDRSGAVQQAIVVGMWFLAYLLARLSVDDEARLRHLAFFVVLAASVWGLFGVGVAAGTFSYAGAWVAARISSVFQYPDSAGAYFGLGLFVALGLAASGSRRWERILWTAVAAALFLPVLLSYSRGVWLLLPAASVAWIATLPRGERLRGLVMGVDVVLAGGAGTYLFTKGVGTHHPVWIWLSEAVAAAVAAGIGLVVEGYLSLSTRGRKAAGWGLVAAVSLGLLGYAVVRDHRPLVLQTAGLPGSPAQTLQIPGGPAREGRPYRVELTLGAQGPTGAQAGTVTVYAVNGKGSQTPEGQQTVTLGPHELHFGPFTAPRGTQSLLLQIVSGSPGTSLVIHRIRVLGPGLHPRTVSLALAKILPLSLYDRVIAINPDALSVWERGYFDRDALKMVAARPLLGWGGSGWAAAYFAYQSFGYFTTQVHNEFLQVAVETGLLGLALYGTLWVLAGRAWLRARAAVSRPGQVLLAGLGSGVLLLVAHSAIDFDLSLTAIAMTLWAVVGGWQGVAFPVPEGALPRDVWQRRERLTRAWAAAGAVVLAGTALVMGAARLLEAENAGQQALSLMAQGKVAQAIGLFQQALDDNPNSATLWASLGQAEAYQAQAVNDNSLLSLAQQDLARAFSLAPRSPNIAMTYGAFLFNHGEVAKGLSLLRRVVALAPHQSPGYDELAQGYAALATYQLQHRQWSSMRRNAREVFRVYRALLQANARAPANLPPDLLMPTNDPPMLASLGEAAAMLGEWNRAAAWLSQVPPSSPFHAQAAAWLAAVGFAQHRVPAPPTTLAGALEAATRGR